MCDVFVSQSPYATSSIVNLQNELRAVNPKLVLSRFIAPAHGGTNMLPTGWACRLHGKFKTRELLSHPTPAANVRSCPQPSL